MRSDEKYWMDGLEIEPVNENDCRCRVIRLLQTIFRLLMAWTMRNLVCEGCLRG